MDPVRNLGLLLVAAVTLGLAGCQSMTRQVNPPLKEIAPTGVEVLGRQEQNAAQRENLVVLAFSGGGTRAAAFS